jgi:hypothetical protein
VKPLNQMTSADVIAMVKGVDKKTLIKIGAGAAGFLIVSIFFVWPAWITRLEVRQQVNDLKNQVTMTQNLLRRKPQLLQDKDKYIKFSQEVKSRMFQPGEASLLLGIVSKMAQESKVSIVSSNPKAFGVKFPPPFDVQYVASAYDFTVEGGFHEFGEFISKLENYSKVLRVQTFHIMPQDKQDKEEKGDGAHLASLSLTAVASKVKTP